MSYSVNIGTTEYTLAVAVNDVVLSSTFGATITQVAAGSITDATAAGRAMIKAASAAAQVALLGAATLTGTQTLTNKTITSLLLTGAPRANGLTATGLGVFLSDLKLGPVFASRTEATSGSTGFTGTANLITVKHNNRLLTYVFDATAGAILTTGDGRTWAPAGTPSIDHAGAVSYTTQAAAIAGTDSAPATQAIVDWLIASNRSEEIEVGQDNYRWDAKITVAKASMGFVGKGKHDTFIMVTHSAGDEALRVTRDNFSFRKLGLVAGTARAAVAFASAGAMCGIRFEAEDLPDNSSLRVRNVNLEDYQILNMPSHGLVFVGAASGRSVGGTITGSKGHNVAIGTDVYPRTNDNGVPGLIIFMTGENTGAGGHSFCFEARTPTTTPATRINILNVEIGQNATDAAVRLSASDAYLDTCEVNIDTCVFKPYTGNEAFLARGINIRAVDCRYGGATRICTVSSGALLQTQNVLIDGAEMFNSPGTYDPLVRLRIESGAAQPANVQVRNFWGGVVNNVIATDGSFTPSPQTIPWLLHNNGGRLTFIKTANQIVNNTTTMVDIADLEMYIGPNEKVIFACTLSYMADTAADLRARMTGPAGSTVTFNVSDSGKVGTGDTYTVQANIDQASQIVVGAGGVAVERMLTLIGSCINGATAGRLRAQFAQSTAGVNDATIVAGRSFVTFTKADN